MKQNNDEIQNKYHKILDNLFCSILVFDENGILVHCNSSAIDLFKRMGIDTEKEYHTPFRIFTDPLAEQINIISGGERIFALTGDDELAFAIPAGWIDRVMEGLEATHKGGVARIPTLTAGVMMKPAFPKYYWELEKYCGLRD